MRPHTNHFLPTNLFLSSPLPSTQLPFIELESQHVITAHQQWCFHFMVSPGTCTEDKAQKAGVTVNNRCNLCVQNMLKLPVHESINS